MRPIIAADGMFGKHIIPELHLCIKIQQVLGKARKSAFLASMLGECYVHLVPQYLWLPPTQGMPLDCLALVAMGGLQS